MAIILVREISLFSFIFPFVLCFFSFFFFQNPYLTSKISIWYLFSVIKKFPSKGGKKDDSVIMYNFSKSYKNNSDHIMGLSHY